MKNRILIISLLVNLILISVFFGGNILTFANNNVVDLCIIIIIILSLSAVFHWAGHRHYKDCYKRNRARVLELVDQKAGAEKRALKHLRISGAKSLTIKEQGRVIKSLKSQKDNYVELSERVEKAEAVNKIYSEFVAEIQSMSKEDFNRDVERNFKEKLRKLQNTLRLYYTEGKYKEMIKELGLDIS